ncbi:hypothetical protein M406DRAFT_325339 [Cryphonectria parasitica EP155]|uniref:2'-phosphotransferase n=1 Tax=Cryphonectria parasitica (strain ATCC 38755 / EP155) TaxID=660469 RepID=A0A9P4YA68_CRYP1|nr:uncharacterized protein M406DRAFT_325339 [Cryphonectria parasitica EP155]KAF3769854.1 hypothetical protein M406DRAFT_325339 [Cryphonectria parasitica EP155]
MDTNDQAEQLEEQVSQQQQQQHHRHGAKGKGGGSKGSGQGAGGGAKREKEVSRALSRLLRHQALNAGIKLDREGYAPLEKVLQWGPLRTLNVSVQEVIDITASNEKQRFSMKAVDNTAAEQADASYWLIRANQGHSIPLDDEGLLNPITLDNIPPTVVHGTYFAFWPSIVENGGLRRMGRNHVHFSTGPPRNSDSNNVVVDDDDDDNNNAPGVISGMRTDAELLVYIDVRRSLEDDAMSWWVSDNGVVLTAGVGEEGLVPATYFKEVVGRRKEDEVGVLWRDGSKVADLPEGLKGRPPPGKSGRRGGRGGRGGRGRGGGRGRERGRGT